jgi:hypothetical protein
VKAPIPNNPRILARLGFDDLVRTLAFGFVFERYAGQDLRVALPIVTRSSHAFIGIWPRKRPRR